jgi:Domain of unknown function (DUF397)
MTTGAEGLAWRRSTRCDSGSCVEVAVTEDRVLLRDSREPDGPRLSVSRTEWLEFLAWARRDFTD